MKLKKLKSLFVIFFISVVITLPSASFAQKTLNIGVIAALTGFGASAEVHFRDGVEMAMEWVNKNGGVSVKGEKYLLKAIIEDHKSTAEGAKIAAEKLVYSDKVKFILGDTFPFINIAVSSVTEPAKVIRGVNYSCENPLEMNPDTPYTFRLNPGTRDGMGSSFDYLVEKYPKIKRYSMITPADGGEKFLIPLTKKEGESRGLTQTGAVAWPQDVVDFYPIMTKALSSNPEAVCLVNAYEQITGQMIKAAREKGFKGPIFMASYDCPYDIAEIAGKDLAAPFWDHGWSQDLDDPLLTSTMRLAITTSKEKLGRFHQWNFWGWNGVLLFKQVIERAQSFDTTEVANAWRKMEDLESVWGPARMGGLKTYGINNVVFSPIAITEILPGGEVKQMKWVNFYLP